MWGEIGAAAVSAGANLMGASKSSKSAAKIAAMQIAWERERAQNAIQWGVQDALKAGINPAVAAGAPASTSGINPPMPDTSGYGEAGKSAGTAMQLILADRQTSAQEKVADSEAGKNKAETMESAVRTGLMPKETAVKQMRAETEREAALKQSQLIDAQINRINKLLPGEAQGQAYELAVKAAENRLTQREMKVLDQTGLTLSEWKGLGENVLGVVKDIGRLKYGSHLLNATRPTRSTHDYYNNTGELTGFRVDKNYY